MKLNTVVLMVAFTSLLVFSSLNASSVGAANPNFSVTSILSPQEGAALFHQYFDADDLFGKGSRKGIKQTYWTPTAAEIYQAENSLANYTDAINNACNQSFIQIDTQPYDIVLTADMRQFTSVVLGSKRLLLINGLSLASNSHDSIFTISGLSTNEALHNRSGHYSDGGSAFRAAYNLDTHRTISLRYDNLVKRKQLKSSGQNLTLTFG